MKKIILFFILMSQFLAAQNYRFLYEYKFAPMKSKPDSLITDYMNLDTDGAKSYFYSAVKSEYDSLATLKKALPTSRRHNININYYITKDLKSKKTNLETDYKGTALSIPETEVIKWKLTDEHAAFGKWKTQKATADYKGRSWEAWFTQELPFQDGPYKFSGLPGLIVKLSDTGHEHNFELIEVKKLPKISFEPYKNPKVMTAEKYRALPPYFNQAEYIEFVNVTKEGIETRLKNGNSLYLKREDMGKKAGDVDGYFSKRLGAGDNPIER